MEINESYFDKKIEDFVSKKRSSVEDLKKEIMSEVQNALDSYKKDNSEKQLLFEKVDSTSYFENNINKYFDKKLSYSNKTNISQVNPNKSSNDETFVKISESETPNLIQNEGQFNYKNFDMKKTKKAQQDKTPKKESNKTNFNTDKINSKNSFGKNVSNSELDYIDTSNSMIFIKQQIENFIVDNRKYF